MTLASDFPSYWQSQNVKPRNHIPDHYELMTTRYDYYFGDQFFKKGTKVRINDREKNGQNSLLHKSYGKIDNNCPEL
jgi:hypothetical protein